MPLIIAIDGPSGSGKSSTAKAIAKRAHWNYLDTGALYRAITWLAIENNLEEESQLVDKAMEIGIRIANDPDAPKVFVGDVDVSDAIRTLRITDKVSEFARMPRVREYMVNMQREIIASAPHGIVVEGRDIGTVVAPEAELKIFLFADLDRKSTRLNSSHT